MGEAELDAPAPADADRSRAWYAPRPGLSSETNRHVFPNGSLAPWARTLLVTLAAVPAIAGAALLAIHVLRPGAATRGAPLDAGPPPAVVYARPLCSFSNEDAKAALVQGADGGESIVIGDKTWWLFGDTLFQAESGKQIEQNSIAWSDSLRPDGCPLLHYYARAGVAIPFLPKDGSLTVWPTGAWPVDDHSFDFYTAYVYGSGPYGYSIDEVGLAHLDTATMQVTVLKRTLWDRDSGFPDNVIGTQPIDLDAEGRLRIVLQTSASTKLLARVRPAALADTSAYEYWDGQAWSPSPANAAPLWPQAHSDDPVQKLASFENGASIAWNEALHKYVALTNIGYSAIGARTADRLEGPWSDAQPWLDCLAFAEPRVPTCYSPLQHPSLATNGGRTILATLTRMATYDVAAFELTLATPIHEYHDGDSVIYGDGSQRAGSDKGVAFDASSDPLPGFVPVYRWRRGAETQYAVAAPADGFARESDAAFYAAPSAAVFGSETKYRRVYDWSNGKSHLLSPLTRGLDQYGYTQGAIAFYVP